MSLIDKVLECTKLECCQCSSVHQMNYIDNSYWCEECYREVSAKSLDPEEIQIDWKKFKKLVKKNSNQLKIIRILLNNICKKQFTKEEIKKYHNDLVTNGSILF